MTPPRIFRDTTNWLDAAFVPEQHVVVHAIDVFANVEAWWSFKGFARWSIDRVLRTVNIFQKLGVRKRGQAQFVRSTLRAVPANWACPLFRMWMRELGRVIPIHYQEPFRRDFSKGWQPKVEDFATDLRGVGDRKYSVVIAHPRACTAGLSSPGLSDR